MLISLFYKLELFVEPRTEEQLVQLTAACNTIGQGAARLRGQHLVHTCDHGRDVSRSGPGAGFSGGVRSRGQPGYCSRRHLEQGDVEIGALIDLSDGTTRSGVIFRMMVQSSSQVTQCASSDPFESL